MSRGERVATAKVDIVSTVRDGYQFDGPALEIGACVVNGVAYADAPVRIPIAMINRHGLVAGATGTGKTKTLQGLAEQLSTAGVPVFLADIKGDLTGLATAGAANDKITQRTAEIGQEWTPTAYPTEYLSLGGKGIGVPVRASITSFGPLLLARVLGLNQTQESSLQLVFHFADMSKLALLDIADLRAVVTYLVSDVGKEALSSLGGLSKATAGVILRELTAFEARGMSVFFGEPEFEPADLLRTASDGRGLITCLELSEVTSDPLLFSTFLMWVLAELFEDLPEVGDIDKPKLVFFFEEAHLLFADASKAFLQAITQTVRMIRSKGVGVYFVTQTPKDVPADVLAQLANRVQHAIRAYTPDDAKALKAAISTFPTSGYDLAELLPALGTGEAIVTVMSESGAPTPVAWTRIRAPQSLMAPSAAEVIATTVAVSTLQAKYGAALDRESAMEILAARQSGGGVPNAEADSERVEVPAVPAPARDEPSVVSEVLRNPAAKAVAVGVATVAMREIFRGIFGTSRKR